MSKEEVKSSKSGMSKIFVIPNGRRNLARASLERLISTTSSVDDEAGAEMADKSSKRRKSSCPSSSSNSRNETRDEDKDLVDRRVSTKKRKLEVKEDQDIKEEVKRPRTSDVQEVKKLINSAAIVKSRSCCECESKLQVVESKNTILAQQCTKFFRLVVHLKEQVQQHKNRKVESVGVQCGDSSFKSSSPNIPTGSQSIRLVQQSPTSHKFAPVAVSQNGPKLTVVTPNAPLRPSAPSQQVRLVMFNNGNHQASPIFKQNGGGDVSSNGSSPSNGVVRFNTSTTTTIRQSPTSNDLPMPPLTRAPNHNNNSSTNGQQQTLTSSNSFTAEVRTAPLPLPKPPTSNKRYPANIGLPPPKPTLTCQTSADPNNAGVQLSWNHSTSQVFTKIKHYHLFAYQDNPNAVWKQVGTIEPLDLPMACTLTAFAPGEKYFFAIRAVDWYERIGPFSEACSLKA